MADDIEKDANLSLVELDKGETLFTFSQITHSSFTHSLISRTVSHSELCTISSAVELSGWLMMIYY